MSKSDEREQWCKVLFEVKLVDDYYACECGMFKHMGMHALSSRREGAVA